MRVAVFFLLVIPYALSFEPGKKYSAHFDPGTSEWSVNEGNGGIADGHWEEHRYQTGP